jgi:hypothetical protein
VNETRIRVGVAIFHGDDKPKRYGIVVDMDGRILYHPETFPTRAEAELLLHEVTDELVVMAAQDLAPGQQLQVAPIFEIESHPQPRSAP